MSSLNAHGEFDATAPLAFAKRTELFAADGSRDTAYMQEIVLAGSASTVAGADGEPRPLKGEAFRTAHFTATLPWRLLDTAALVSRLPDTVWQVLAGTAGLAEDAAIARLAVSYPGDPAGEAWVHFFEAATGHHLGYRVAHGTGHALVVNLELVRRGGMLLPARRITYRLDKTGELAFKRATFDYVY